VALDQADESVTARPPTQEDGLKHRELLRALATLPEDQRSVLLLVSVEDLSYAEAARVLDIPVGTVMSRLSRAREKLSRAMAPDPSGAMAPDPAVPVQRPTLRRVK
jgi:RNA polymerase sigma-70 factor (ECF subfamily)